MTKQVRSKQRVAEHGEVFTAEREVKAMCDLVKQEAESIDSRFLEPACGDGNFLSEILSRKLATVKKRYRKSPFDYEKYAILALSSIYGVDILLDNAIACRERLFVIWNREYRTVCRRECRDGTRAAARFILSRNIVCGNALSLRCADASGKDTTEPIVFSEWAFITGTQMQRKDYTFDELLSGYNKTLKAHTEEQLSLFKKPGPEEEGRFLKQYVSDYRRVQENG